MTGEKFLISSKPIEISEYQDYKLATFMISVLDEFDLNGRIIPKDVGEECHKTIIGFPIVAKLVCDIFGNPTDFAGHEVYTKTDKNGNKDMRFGTQPIGSVLNSWIEDREVLGYTGVKSCIMIQAKLWSTRYPEYFKVLDDLWAKDSVDSSWELSIIESEKTTKGKIIKAFTFIGNCLLGSKVKGAVPNAGIIAYAEINDEIPDISLATALSKDMVVSNIINKEQEDTDLEKTNIELIATEDIEKATENPVVLEIKTTEEAASSETVTTEATSEESQVQEISSLTEWDLRSKLRDACRAKIDNWCYISFHFPLEKKIWVEVDGRKSELDFVLFTYEVDADENIVLSEPQETKLTVAITEVNNVISQKSDAIIAANEKIQELSSEISTLKPFKEACEKVDRERIEAETSQKRVDLLSKVENSKLFSAEELETSEIKQLIENIDESAIKNMIADRFIASLECEDVSKTSKTETFEVKTETASTKADIDSDEIGMSFKELMQTYSNKR